jgi:hypothetical protein
LCRLEGSALNAALHFPRPPGRQSRHPEGAVNTLLEGVGVSILISKDAGDRLGGEQIAALVMRAPHIIILFYRHAVRLHAPRSPNHFRTAGSARVYEPGKKPVSVMKPSRMIDTPTVGTDCSVDT